MAERLIRIRYAGSGDEKWTAAATIDGSLRAAMTRVFNEQFDVAEIYDLRYGGDTTRPANHVLTVQRYADAVHTNWWTGARPHDPPKEKKRARKK